MPSRGRGSEYNVGIKLAFIVGNTFPVGDGVVDGVEAQERDTNACNEAAGGGVAVVVVDGVVAENNARDRRVKVADRTRGRDLSGVDPVVTEENFGVSAVTKSNGLPTDIAAINGVRSPSSPRYFTSTFEPRDHPMPMSLAFGISERMYLRAVRRSSVYAPQ